MSELHPIGCEKAQRTADVVFIHGLGGDAFTTWRHGQDDSSSWPHWLAQEFPQVQVWSLGYAASPSKWLRVPGWFSRRWREKSYTLALPDRSVQVLDLMSQRQLGQRPILFVCHSLGGLLAKQILRLASEATDGKKKAVFERARGVLFLATPHAGAGLASLMNALRVLVGATASIEDLRARSPHLRELDNWYRKHSGPAGIDTKTYYETRGVFGLKIVSETSASPGAGEDPVPLDEDHRSIAKPRHPDAQVCGAARDLLRSHVLAAPQVIPATTPGTAPVPPPAAPVEVILRPDPAARASAEPPRVPRELPPAAYKFFGRRTELQRLTERLRAALNTAVVGPAGLGKTALAAHALAEVVGADMSHLAASPFPDGLVYLDLYTCHGQAEPAWNTLANRLRGADFMERRTAAERATEACRARRLLLILEGGEEADGTPGRTTLPELLKVLSPENRWLLLTRASTQAAVAETIELKEALDPREAEALLDWLTRDRPLTVTVRQPVLELLEGHPLALNWAGNLLARGDEDPARLACDWKSSRLPNLSDPQRAEHTLQWLFDRSARGLDGPARQALAAAGLLARAPFPLGAIVAALAGEDAGPDAEARPRQALRSLVQRGLLQRAETDHWQFTHVLGYRFARHEDDSEPALRHRLGRWLHAHLTAVLQTQAGGQPAAYLGRSLQHAAALLRADHDQQLGQPLARYLLYDAFGRLRELGRLEWMKQALGAFGGWLERFPPAKATEPCWQRERSSMLDRQGDVLCAQGDLAEALGAYREALAVIQRLAATDPSNVGWQQDLSVSHIKLGGLLSAQGDLAGALGAYRDSLAVIQPLAATDPSNAGWQRSLSASQIRLGGVLSAQGDLAGALGTYQQALAIAQRLAANDPSNVGRQWDLASAHCFVGIVLQEQGSLAEALEACRKSRDGMQRLTAADPSHAGWQRDLSVSQIKVGDVLRAQGDSAGALGAYREALAVMQRLAAADPSNAGWQRDLSVSQERLGEVLCAQGDLAGALGAYREALAVRQRLAATDPSNAGWQYDLGIGNERLGDMLLAQGNLAEARQAYEHRRDIISRLAVIDPSNAEWQRDLSVSHNKLGDALSAQGDLAGALGAYRESLAVKQRLAAADPSNAGWQRGLSVTHTLIGQVLMKQRQWQDALPHLEMSLRIGERIAALDPTNATWQQDVQVSRRLLSEVRANLP